MIMGKFKLTRRIVLVGVLHLRLVARFARVRAVLGHPSGVDRAFSVYGPEIALLAVRVDVLAGSCQENNCPIDISAKRDVKEGLEQVPALKVHGWDGVHLLKPRKQKVSVDKE